MKVRKVIMLTTLVMLLWLTKINAQCGSTNVALNKTVTTSSNGAGTAAASVTDGVVSNVWQPTYSADNYAQVDLGSSKTICRVLVKWGRWNAASSFKIQMSSTGTGSWVDIASVTNNNAAVGNESGSYYTWYVFNDLNITGGNNTARYIRLWAGTISGANWFVSEMEVFELATNLPPTCNFTNPTSNITIAANTPLLLKANATDVDGTISEVGFYSGATSTSITTLLSDPPQTAAPYEYTWIPTVAGTYYIQAKATDNNGAQGLSASVTVTVTAVTGGGAWSLSGNTVSDTDLPNTFIGTSNAQDLVIRTSSLERLRITKTGKMIIGTSGFPAGAPADALLAVKGQIWARVLKVTQLNWPDYVFEKNYNLMPLPELATFIRKYKHLPGVPSVKEVTKGGINVGDNQAVLLKKIEELTLYLLEQNKKIEGLLKKSDDQQMEIEKLKKK